MAPRYTLVRQNDTGDGGAAALATVCLHHGIAVELTQLRPLAGPGLQGLTRLAEQLGLAPRSVKTGFDQLTSLPLPALAPLRSATGGEQIVVVHRAARDSVVIADPAQERIQTLPRDSFCQVWTGKVLLLTPPSADISLGPPDTSPTRRLMALLGGQWLFLAEALVCSFLMALLGVAAAHGLRHLIDGVLPRGGGGLLTALVVGLVLVVVFRVAFGLARDHLLLAVGRRLDALLAARYLQRLVRQPVSCFQDDSAGAIQARLQATSRLRSTLGGAILGGLFDGLAVVVGLAALAAVAPRMAGLAAAAVVTVAVVSWLGGVGLAERSERAAGAEEQLAAELVEEANGAATLRGYGAERPRAEEAERRMVRWLHAGWDIERSDLWLRWATRLILGLGLVGVLWAGGRQASAGHCSVGQFVFALAVVVQMFEAGRRLAESQPQWRLGVVALDRLARVLETQPEPAAGRRKAVFQELQRGIELLDVSFAYPQRGVILDRVTLTVPAGRTIAVVGASGAGKSTLLRLLHGQGEPSGGQLKVDGVDLRDIDRASLRDHVTLVPQRPHIFRATVAENVALGNPEAGLAEITGAVQAVGLEEFVNRLPQRYDTVLAEGGSDLSAGQQQQLGLARALLRQPRVLLLDDATSDLDPSVEKAILDGARWSLPGRTLVVVARHLASLRHADWIYVLHQGRVVEAGPHLDLLATGGLYAQMWQGQCDPGDSSSQSDSLASLATHTIPRPGKH